MRGASYCWDAYPSMPYFQNRSTGEKLSSLSSESPVAQRFQRQLTSNVLRYSDTLQVTGSPR
jgi:hypothetical protein